MAGETSVSRLPLSERQRLLSPVLNREITKKKKIAMPASVSTASIPSSFDWRNKDGKNWVTPVKNQGSCGICDIFALMASVESNYMIKYNSPGLSIDLSEQYAAVCSRNWNHGFQGYNSGVYVDESCAPYECTAENFPGPCNACSDWADRRVSVQDYYFIDGATAEDVKQAIVSGGPVDIPLNVGEDFVYYSSGSYSSVVKPASVINHVVLAIGYDDSKNAFLIKNSWGTSWGDSGYGWVSYSVEDAWIENNLFPRVVVNASSIPVVRYTPECDYIERVDTCDSVLMSEGSSKQFSAIATDADGDALSYKWFVDVSLQATTPDFNFSPGFDSSDSDTRHQIDVIVSDGTFDIHRTWSVTVADVDLPPVIQSFSPSNQNLDINQGSSVSFTVTAFDPEGKPLSYSWKLDGSSVGSNSSSFDYSPSVSDIGNHSLIATASNGVFSESVSWSVSVHEVVSPNTAPELAPIANITVSEGEQVQVIADASDIAGDTLTYSSDFNNFSQNENKFTWNTSFSDAGTYAVSISVSDGQLSDQKSFTVTVNNTNRAPELESISNISVQEGEQVSVTAVASDPDNDSLSFSIDNPDFSQTGNNFVWSTGFEDAGTYTVKLTVSDGLLSDQKSFTVTVYNSNRAPSLNSIADIVVQEGDNVLITAIASDLDGDALTYSIDSLNFSQNNNSFEWQTGFNDEGVYNLKVSVSDGSLFDEENFTITVKNAVKVELEAGMSMISVPVVPENPNFDALDTDCSFEAIAFWNPLAELHQTAYKYELFGNNGTGVYQQISTLSFKPGQAYFVKVSSDCSIRFIGEEFNLSLVKPKLGSEPWAGWNMVGVPRDAGLNDVIGDCNIVSGPWGYNQATNTYFLASTFQLGQGYWIEVNKSCEFGLNSTGIVSRAAAAQPPSIDNQSGSDNSQNNNPENNSNNTDQSLASGEDHGQESGQRTGQQTGQSSGQEAEQEEPIGQDNDSGNILSENNQSPAEETSSRIERLRIVTEALSSSHTIPVSNSNSRILSNLRALYSGFKESFSVR
ncbi:MAG: C1 family peptidase [Candidatus Hodarchaeales archaeon]